MGVARGDDAALCREAMAEFPTPTLKRRSKVTQRRGYDGVGR